MRLICGVFNLDGSSVSEDHLLAMARAMAVPRLRPALGLWCEGPAGLAVLDFSFRGGPAPVFRESTAAILAADVRLDEPVALGRTLGRASQLSEDALLLAALDTYGPAGLDKVLGDFAFARWEQGALRLTCGRDALGIRPFSYSYQPGKLFAFASLAKALHGTGIVAKRIDEEALVRRAACAMRSGDSLIADIKRLPPAHFLEVSREGISVKRYWHIDRAAVGRSRCSPDEAARELRRLVDQAVHCRLPRVGETGAHLSGGLDSSAIAVLAARQLRGQGRTLHAYSFLDRQRNDVTLEDETEFVKSVIDQEGDIDWTPIRPPPAAFALDQGLDADEMVGLAADHPENAVCARAEAQGVGLVLTGWGGDEAATFNGRGVLAELFFRGRWRALAREIAALNRERGLPHHRIVRGEILSHIWGALLPGFVLKLATTRRGKSPPLLALRRRALSAAARQRLAASCDIPLTLGPDGRDNRWRMMTGPHIARITDQLAYAGARYGLAFAFPLLDRRVVEFALSLSSELFLRDGFRRRVFRDAMAGALPDAVRLRHSKFRPFPSRMIDIVESKEELLARIGSYEKNENVSRVIDLAYLRGLIEAFPSAESIRAEMHGNSLPADAARIAAAAGMFVTAAYLDEHGGQSIDRTLQADGRPPLNPASAARCDTPSN